MSQFTKRNQKSGANMNFYSKLSVFAVAISLLFVGCKDNPANKGNTAKDTNKPILRVVNDVDERTTDLSNDGNNKVKLQGQDNVAAVTFEALAQVEPPTGLNADGPLGARSLELHESGSRRVYVAYKVLFDEQPNADQDIRGGGVDVLDASSPNTPSSNSSSLQSDVLNVYDVTHTNNYILMAASAEEDETAFVNAAALVRADIQSDGDPANTLNTDYADVTDETATGETSLLKGVIEAPGSTYEIFAVDDGEDIYQWGEADNLTTYDINNNPGATYRSLTSVTRDADSYLHTNSQLYKLNDQGNIGSVDNFGSISDSTISDISSHNFDSQNTSIGNDMIFVPLNENGFRVYNQASSISNIQLRFEDDPTGSGGPSISTVTATDNYVYAAGGSNIWVYEVDESGLQNTNTDEGLNLIDRLDVEQFGDDEEPNDFPGVDSNDPINDILAFEASGNQYLYLAKSQDGVIVLEQKGGELFN